MAVAWRVSLWLWRAGVVICACGLTLKMRHLKLIGGTEIIPTVNFISSSNTDVLLQSFILILECRDDQTWSLGNVLQVLLSFPCRCYWKAEAGVYLEQRCCCSSHHFLPTGSPQGQYLGLPCGRSRCGIWKPDVCLSGNGLWGEKNLISLCCLLSFVVPLLFLICLWRWGTLAAFADWDDSHLLRAYLLSLLPSVRIGKSLLFWWFLNSCCSTANVRIFFLSSFSCASSSKLSFGLHSNVTQNCFPIRQLCSSFNNFFERHLHVLCFRKQTMIQQEKQQPTHSRHWHFMNWTWVWTTLLGNTVSLWKSMATSL